MLQRIQKMCSSMGLYMHDWSEILKIPEIIQIHTPSRMPVKSQPWTPHSFDSGEPKQLSATTFRTIPPPRPDQNHTKGTRPHIATSAGPAKAPKTSSWSCSSMTQPPSVSPTANQRLPSTCTDTSEARITWRWLGYCLNLVQPIRKIGRPPNLMDFDGFKLHFPCKTAIGLPFSDPDQLKRVAWHLFYCRGSRWSWRPWFFCQSRACSYWVTNPFSLIFNNPRKPSFSRGFIHTFGTIQWGCWIWTGGLD